MNKAQCHVVTISWLYHNSLLYNWELARFKKFKCWPTTEFIARSLFILFLYICNKLWTISIRSISHRENLVLITVARDTQLTTAIVKNSSYFFTRINLSISKLSLAYKRNFARFHSNNTFFYFLEISFNRTIIHSDLF